MVYHQIIKSRDGFICSQCKQTIDKQYLCLNCNIAVPDSKFLEIVKRSFDHVYIGICRDCTTQSIREDKARLGI